MKTPIRKPTLMVLIMIVIFIWVLPLASPAQGSQTLTREASRQVRRLVLLLDYIAADYPLAVRDGRILSGLE